MKTRLDILEILQENSKFESTLELIQYLKNTKLCERTTGRHGCDCSEIHNLVFSLEGDRQPLTNRFLILLF